MGKSAQTSTECNKLIMVSRVPGFGHLEYLVLELLIGSHHSNLLCWDVNDYFNGD